MRWSVAVCGLLLLPAAGQEVVLETTAARLRCDASGRVLSLRDRRDDRELVATGRPLATVRQGTVTQPVTTLTRTAAGLRLVFGAAGPTVDLRVTSQPRHWVWEVTAVSGPAPDELTLVDLLPLPPPATADPPATCALALNLQTRVQELPGLGGPLRAVAYQRTGLVGAAVALFVGPRSQLRDELKAMITAAPAVPRTAVGGPWALDSPANRGSYLFNFSDLTPATVDQWIAVAQSIGATQIDFHGGTSFRFGDCRPNPKLYPNGVADVKLVLDKLHAAGILAGLHTYAFFIDKTSPWVTPRPDPRLGKDRTLTLAAALPADATTVPVAESTQGMSSTTGFFVRNSATVQIDDELVVYTTVAQQAPFGFSGCRRGAYGTTPAGHAAGAPVHHLRECFGLFLPDGDSTLLTEVAAKTAEFYNAAGFDMIYLDALDGEDAIAGREWGWHYGGKFAWAIAERLQRPAIFEMSTFHHHLWPLRSRMGAWDHPNRGHQPFIDRHLASNANCAAMFLPTQLGWWAFKTWQAPQGEPTFAEDIEYLCVKALATDSGLSIMGIDPTTAPTIAALPRLAAIVRRYEELRRAGTVSPTVRQVLAQPGREFALEPADHGPPQFREWHRARQVVSPAVPPSAAWQITNPAAAQAPTLRLEALSATGPYEAPQNPVLAAFDRPDEFAAPAAAAGVTVSLAPSTAQLHGTASSGWLQARSTRPAAAGAWARLTKTYDPPLNLTAAPAMGLWVHGDGSGVLLNVQRTSPPHLSHAINDHYQVIDFQGWRYVELAEPEAARYGDYRWPYGDIYSIYREALRYDQVATLTLYLNNLPPNQPVNLYLSPIRALPWDQAAVVNPSLTIDDRTTDYPVTLTPGQYLEHDASGATQYGPRGEVLAKIAPTGTPLRCDPGANALRWHQTGAGRARVTVGMRGEAVEE
ncbi:MAG: hypothetical protein IT204_16965 [Fimbriimonadaceae bacterium]|nr:hypothetical protein [Fimbriimonadaceae bacterium]